MSKTQRERIDANVGGEQPDPVELVVSFRGLSDRPQEVLTRVREVMRLVAAHQANNWPDDDAWKRELPAWFLSSFTRHTQAELLADRNLWDFGSWLDAMRSPGWEWWSSEARASEGRILASAHSDPYSIDPLLYLVRSAGAEGVRLEER